MIVAQDARIPCGHCFLFSVVDVLLKLGMRTGMRFVPFTLTTLIGMADFGSLFLVAIPMIVAPVYAFVFLVFGFIERLTNPSRARQRLRISLYLDTVPAVVFTFIFVMQFQGDEQNPQNGDSPFFRGNIAGLAGYLFAQTCLLIPLAIALTALLLMIRLGKEKQAILPQRGNGAEEGGRW